MGWGIAAGIAGLLILVIIIQFNRKSVYGKAVLQELERLPEGQLLMNVRENPNEDIRAEMAHLQAECMKKGYAKNLPPSVAAQVIVDAFKSMGQEPDQVEKDEPSDFSSYQMSVFASAAQERDERGHTDNRWEIALDLEIEAFVAANAMFNTYLDWDQRPPIEIGEEGWATVAYPIAKSEDLSGDGEFFNTRVETTSDGGLVFYDYGVGAAAEKFSSGGSGVESYLSLSPEQSRQLFVALGGWKDDTSVRIGLRLAIGFAVKYSGDAQAFTHISEFCESRGVHPKSYIHFERD